MESTPVSKKQTKQPLAARLGFFVLGGVGSTTLNSSILDATKHFWGWPYVAGYAFSAASTALVFFLWSYFINFRTSRVWKNCLGRYVACVLLALLMNYLIGICGLKHFGSTRLARFLVIGVVQSFTGGIKFLLYHFWVFPYADGPARSEPAAMTPQAR
jgi:putative flippase GtrA